MDSNYNVEGAGKKLEEISVDRYNSAHSGTQLSRIVSVSAHYEAVPAGRSWVLVLRNTNEELVVSFQGVILKKDLPPFTQKLGRGVQQVKYLRQSVSIASLGAPTFLKSVNAIGEIHAVLGRAVGMDNVAECGMISIVDDKPIIELGNRYFKPQGLASEDDAVVLSSAIDPHGVLAKAAQASGLYHSEENVVQYFERHGDDDENYRYVEAKPIIFGIGDIVEVQASFTIFPRKDGKYKSAMVLRGLTLLDGSFTQARLRNMTVQLSQAVIPRPIKRKVGYDAEEMSSTRAKIMKMDLDDRAELTSVSGGTGNQQMKAGKAADQEFTAVSEDTLD